MDHEVSKNVNMDTSVESQLEGTLGKESGSVENDKYDP